MLAAAWLAVRADPPKPADLERLVKQLGHDDFSKREEATKRLEELGEAALEAVRLARTSDDLEIRWRATEIARRIERRLFGEELALAGHTNGIVAVAVSPDSRYAATGGNDATVRLWDLKEGKELRRLNGISSSVWAVAFSPDGKQLLAGNSAGQLGLWDFATGQLGHAAQLEQHPKAVRCVSFTPDGKFAFTGSYDFKARLLDVETGKQVRVFEGQGDFHHEPGHGRRRTKFGLTGGGQRGIRP